MFNLITKMIENTTITATTTTPTTPTTSMYKFLNQILFGT